MSSPNTLSGLGFILISVVVVSAAVVLIVGIPAFLILRKLKHDSWVTLPITGFVLGGLSLVFSWPKQYEGFSARMNWHGKLVATYINGNPTTYAWLGYGENVLYYGIHGLIGASVFYAVWRKLGHSITSQQAPPDGDAA